MTHSMQIFVTTLLILPVSAMGMDMNGGTCKSADTDACEDGEAVNLMQTHLKLHLQEDKGNVEDGEGCDSCGFKPNSNIGWTGKETVSWVGMDGGWQKCCDECKAKAGDSPPCAAWVFIHDGHCYQKYDTGEFPVTLSGGGDSSGSDAGLIFNSCGFKASSNIGWTGKETVSWVGKEAGWPECCKQCKAKSFDSPPCAAWVFIHDGHCYQKYDTGDYPVTLSYGGDSAGSDAGKLPPFKYCTTEFKANSNIGWTGKETVSYVGKDGGWQKCADECKAKAGDSPPCAAWVFIHDGHCYQKYDTGKFPVTLSYGGDSSGSDAGVLGCSTSGFQANSNIGWTGKESVTYVGKENWPKCREQCQAKAFDDPPCAGWVFIHDGHCYQKYDTGEFPVTLKKGGDSSGSDAALVSTC